MNSECPSCRSLNADVANRVAAGDLQWQFDPNAGRCPHRLEIRITASNLTKTLIVDTSDGLAVYLRDDDGQPDPPLVCLWTEDAESSEAREDMAVLAAQM